MIWSPAGPSSREFSGAPRCFPRLRDEGAAGLHEVPRGRFRVVNLEGHPDSGARLTVGFHLVDVFDLRRVGEFQGGAARVQDRDACFALAGDRLTFHESENVTVKGQGGVVILRLNDEPQLPDRRRGVIFGSHTRTLGRTVPERNTADRYCRPGRRRGLSPVRRRVPRVCGAGPATPRRSPDAAPCRRQARPAPTAAPGFPGR